MSRTLRDACDRLRAAEKGPAHRHLNYDPDGRVVHPGTEPVDVLDDVVTLLVEREMVDRDLAPWREKRVHVAPREGRGLGLERRLYMVSPARQEALRPKVVILQRLKRALHSRPRLPTSTSYPSDVTLVPQHWKTSLPRTGSTTL